MPAVSYVLNLGPAVDVGVDADQVRGVLAAVAPIVGTARVVFALGAIADALEIELEAAEARPRRSCRGPSCLRRGRGVEHYSLVHPIWAMPAPPAESCSWATCYRPNGGHLSDKPVFLYAAIYRRHRG